MVSRRRRRQNLLVLRRILPVIVRAGTIDRSSSISSRANVLRNLVMNSPSAKYPASCKSLTSLAGASRTFHQAQETHKDFELFAHANGQWANRFFGVWT